MPDETCPVQWMGQQALVTLPQHINRGNADQIREQLLWIINRGAAVLIADLTGTLSCDFSGADALARAHHRAVANGAELRLVVTADVVRRLLALNGLDRLVAIYPDLDGALAAGVERRQVHGEPGTRIADHEARAEELLHVVVASIFDVGVILQAATDLPPDVTAQRITEALRRLDDAVRTTPDDPGKHRSRLLPAFGHLPGLIGKGPPPLDLGLIVDTSWRAEEVSSPLQQRGGIGRSGIQCARCLRHVPLQQLRAGHGLRRTL